MNTKEIQQALLALGYKLPKFGADGFWGAETADAVKAFQKDQRMAVTGNTDASTTSALKASVMAKAVAQASQPAGIVPLDWMPICDMHGIVVHWTAGTYNATQLDRSHYHLLIDGDSRLVRGTPSIKDNAAPMTKAYAAHTKGNNTGWIGVSICSMGGAVESPFDSGKYPMKVAQWQMLPAVLSDLCRRYNIPIAANRVLSHAEVQSTLGKPQNGKWDIARLSFDPTLKGARNIGDTFRRQTAKLLAG